MATPQQRNTWKRQRQPSGSWHCRRRSTPRQLRLEALEDRRLLAANIISTMPPASSHSGPVNSDIEAAFDATLGGSILADAAGLQEAIAADAIVDPSSFLPGEILIKLRDPSGAAPVSVPGVAGSATGLAATAEPLSSLATLTNSLGAGSLEPVFTRFKNPQLVYPDLGPAALSLGESDGAEPEMPDLSSWYRLELAAGTDMDGAIAAFEAELEVALVEPNYLWRPADSIPIPIEGIPDATTDPDFDTQWFHTNAETPEAWVYLKENGVYPGGARDVVVAVIDTGVDYTHEELVGNMWINAGEIPDNGIDDDGNGFVDDVHGANVVSDGRSESGDPTDLNGHGTHVAGIIAAQGYNDLGGVGVAFNTQIMAIRAAQYSGTLATQDIAEAILYAVDNGAEVINMSFGGPQRSQIVEDALAVAFSQAALVAAAGNNGVSMPFYPAALPYVLGVMASTPSDGRASFSNSGPWYELMAPGTGIYSTLPGNSYASWSGTSMAAPIVSGVAALMRSFYFERDVYSSRFIMSNIAATTTGGVVDAYRALTEPPKPGVVVFENWLFDDDTIAVGNDGDGRIDSGETVNIGIELINRGGQADLVSATLEARTPGAVIDDPFVTFDVGTVEYGSIGPFNRKDNGFVRDIEGVLVSVSDPFVITLDSNTPNDHVIPFVLTTTFRNGWDLDDTSIYTRVDRFEYVVQRGKNIPTVITEDLTLSSDDFWIVGGPVLIEPGATLTIGPGTQVQWGAISDDPYNPGPQTGDLVVRGTLLVQGTQDEPVALFPSAFVSGQTTSIRVDGGVADLSYAEVRNPNLNGFRNIDHAYFDWEAFSSWIVAKRISNSTFHKLRGGGQIRGEVVDTVQFDSGTLGPYRPDYLRNSTFLQDNENNSPLSLDVLATIGRDSELHYARTYGDKTYALLGVPCDLTGGYYVANPGYLDIEYFQPFAEYFGGNVVTISDEAEQALLEDYMSTAPAEGKCNSSGGVLYAIGLDNDFNDPGEFRWVNGEPLDYTNWPNGTPPEFSWGKALALFGNPWGAATANGLGDYRPRRLLAILELPGEVTEEELQAASGSPELLQFVSDRVEGPYRKNAFLSPYWDPNVNNWMRISTFHDSSLLNATMTDNYWGTDSEVLIDHAIIDFYDNFVDSRVDYGTPPSHGFASTYPFVESVLINGIPAKTVPELGAGPTTFALTFNRDMATDVQPFVTFGPTVPLTDYVVDPTGQVDAIFTVSLSVPSSRQVTVDYATVDGTALAGIDYEAATGTLTFEPGQTQRTIRVPILGDVLNELDKSFSVQLANATVATADGLGDGTIGDDDPVLSIGDVSLAEGDSGTTDAVLTVSLSAASSETVTVEYTTEDGSATAGVDYQAVSSVATFLPGETEQTVLVPVIGDTLFEQDRTFSVKLSFPTVANLVDDEAVVTIRDDDPVVSIDDVALVEGDSGAANASFTVSLSSPTAKTITVQYATADAAALAGEDYQTVGGTLTFEPGEPSEQTIDVPVLGDTLEEVNQDFLVNLSNPTGAALADGVGQGTIIGDDGPLLSIDDVAIVERDAGTTDLVFTVTISADPSQSVTVDYTTVDDTATAADDYQPVSGTLSFDPGQPTQQTVLVPIVGDTSSETDETFFVRLSNATIAAVSDDLGAGTITNDDAVLWVDDVQIVEGDSGTVDAAVTVRISLDPDQTVTVNYATADGEATAGLDYQTVSGTLTFDPGQPLQQTILVPVIGDTVDELDETFQFQLSGVVGAEISSAPGTVTITDDDDPSITIDNATVTEGDTGTVDAVFTVTLSRSPAETVTVDYATADAAATAAVDYMPENGTLTFQPGETEQTIVVRVIGDLLDELDEDFRVDLANATNATIAVAQAQGLIRDDEPQLTIDDVALVEGDSGTTDAVFTVSLLQASSETVTVDYATADGSAVAGVDYQPASGTLTFLPGQPLQQTIVVPVVGDTASETNETFLMDLANAVGAFVADAQGEATIVGDDGPLLSIGDAQLVEGDGGTTNMALTVTISADPAERVTVNYATVDGTAVAGLDYSAVSATLVFDPGQPTQQTVLVPVIGDLLAEPDENFFVELSGATVAAVSDALGEGTITDDDPVLSINDVVLAEGTSGATDAVFTVSLSIDPNETVTVDFATAENTATEGVDYLAASGTLTFQPGQPLQQTITVQVLGDITNEIDETFSVDLTNATGTAVPAFQDAQGVGTITDEDGPTLWIDDAALVEGASGTTDMQLNVTLPAASGQIVTVDYATADGTALAGIDYQAVQGTLTFNPGEVTQPVLVPILGDNIDELDETFTVVLSNATGVPVSDAQGQGTILDDDEAVLSIDDVAVAEGYDGWVNNQTWQGSFYITPVTGDGFHEMLISGAAAADDPWLVTGDDAGRFRFEVQTMGVAALTLQATGAEGRIDLNWQQNDFDLLAGYNVYRSDTIDGVYDRINGTIIPVGQEFYTDTDVVPAVPEFYQFTVVQTDLTESVFSNVASASAFDTIPPDIVHVPPSSALPGLGLRLTADVTDNVSVAGVDLFYRAMGGADPFGTLSMLNTTGDSWSVTIPGSSVQSPGVDYYIVATDGNSLTFDGTPTAPHSVVVIDTPTLASVAPAEGTIDGGQSVSLSGTLFQTGAEVYFGGIPASDIVVLSGNQITATTPAHFPAQVDVTVINPDLSEATLLNGYRYVDQGIVVSLPDTTGEFGTMVELPLSIANVTGLRAVDVTVTFDASVLSTSSVRTGSLTSGWTTSFNTTVPGTVILSMANQTSVSGSGQLAHITFAVVGAPPASTALTLSSVSLNDGAIATDLSDGSLTVSGLFTVSGGVDYFSSGPVAGTTLDLVGVGTQQDVTDAAGQFSLIDVPTGTYTLTPAKDDDVVEITAFDASLVLQSSSGLITLDGNQTLAADVNRNGTVTALDASYILEHSVGLLGVPFPGAGRVWDFVPQERGYALLNSDQTAQDFTAVLIGDVSGNWPSGGGAGMAAATADGPLQTTALSLPQAEAHFGDQVVLPLAIDRQGANVYSLDLVLSYDPSVLSAVGVNAGAAAGGMGMAANTSQPGTVRVGLSSAVPLGQDGVLLQFTFDVVGPLGAGTPIVMVEAEINEGAVPVDLVHGSIILPAAFAGDMDLDGDVDFDDIDDFVRGLNDASGYFTAFGLPASYNGDTDADGDLDFDDIAGFVTILSTQIAGYTADTDLDGDVDFDDIAGFVAALEGTGGGLQGPRAGITTHVVQNDVAGTGEIDRFVTLLLLGSGQVQEEPPQRMVEAREAVRAAALDAVAYEYPPAEQASVALRRFRGLSQQADRQPTDEELAVVWSGRDRWFGDELAEGISGTSRSLWHRTLARRASE